MKVTLQLKDGRVINFSDVENISILEDITSDGKQVLNQTAQIPTEGKWFEVNPSTINQNLFIKKRRNSMQESTRKLILEAFEYLQEHPERNKAFKTLVPEKTWERKTVGELKKMASQLGDHIADWVEQALEWAQRIANGESWEAICNMADTASWNRLVVWGDGYARRVGGSRQNNDGAPTSYVYDRLFYYDFNFIRSIVPLVVSYDV